MLAANMHSQGELAERGPKVRLIRSLLAMTLTVTTLVSPLLSQGSTSREINFSPLPSPYREQLRSYLETENTPAPYRKGRAPHQGPGTGVAKGHWIVVDTRDKEACARVRESLRSYREVDSYARHQMCETPDQEHPFISVLVFDDVDAKEFRRSLSSGIESPEERDIVRDTRNLALAMVGVMGLLWVMPESISGWNRDEIRNTEGHIFHQYKKNIRGRPVVDRDKWYINYIGHPVSGAAYYTIARHNGLTEMESFGYSVLMSTFFWEYGFEAFAERPSIQDLIVTPVIGSILGELFYQTEMKIRQDGGTVFGSRRLGKIALAVLNPIAGISNTINRMLGAPVIRHGKAELVMRSGRPHGDPHGQVSNYIGVHIRFLFN
jgi:hypothetical protein